VPIRPWPFFPERLTDIWDEDLVKFFQSGSAVHTRLPMSIVELRPGPLGKPQPFSIQPYDRWLNYTPFCKYLRGDAETAPGAFPGGDKACKECDEQTALEFLQGRLHPEPGHTGVAYRCHMHLWDYVAPIEVLGRRVAAIFGGQRRPEGLVGVQEIRSQVDKIGTPKSPIGGTSDAKKRLRLLIDEITPEDGGTLEKLEQQAMSIAELATERCHRNKKELEKDFLASPGLKICDTVNGPALEKDLARLLGEIVMWCGVEFAFVLVTEKPGDHLLTRLVHYGLPHDLSESKLHFNWTKAGLPGFETGTFEKPTDSRDLLKGLRGEKAKTIASRIGFAYAVSLVTEHRMVLCLGRRNDGMDLAGESDFLARLASHVCHPYLERKQFLELKSREELWEDVASLIGHQVRGELQAIEAEADMARVHLLDPKDWVPEERARAALDIIMAECDALADYASEILEFWHWIVGRNHRKFEKRSLAETVNLCATRFRGVAERARIAIWVDPALKEIPHVDALGKTIDIAIGNILENAVKYSFDDKVIKLRGFVNKGNAHLEIEDFGIGIPEDEREKVFKKGYRSNHRGRKMARDGQGLGAWQAREIVQAHGGRIECYSKSGDRQPQPGDVHGFRTVFTIVIPVDQSKRYEEEV